MTNAGADAPGDRSDRSLASGGGRVIWITGLSGVGKSTVAQHVHAQVLVRTPGTVLIDGDIFRQTCEQQSGYSTAERLVVARRVSALCKLLCDQNIVVICAVIGLFREIQDWNRNHLTGYFEVYLHADPAVLFGRSELYRKAAAGEASNVVGVDLPFDAPQHPELSVDTGPSSVDFDVVADRIVSTIWPTWSGDNT